MSSVLSFLYTFSFALLINSHKSGIQGHFPGIGTYILRHSSFSFPNRTYFHSQVFFTSCSLNSTMTFLILFLSFLLFCQSDSFKAPFSVTKIVAHKSKGHSLSLSLLDESPLYRRVCVSLFTSVRDNDGEDDSISAIMVKEESRSPILNGTEQKSSSQSFFEKLDLAGLKLKPKAVAARDKALEVRKTDKLISFLYTAKACSLIALFIIYRAYRGFFVVLPAVFKNVYLKLELAVDNPFDPSIELRDQDLDPKTGKLRGRSRIVVSLLAGMVTASYVVNGAFRVALKFIRSIIATSSVEVRVVFPFFVFVMF